MKISEMNATQKQVFMLVVEEANQWIGGYENTMLDFPDEADEYKNAQNRLGNHDELVSDIYSNIRISLAWRKIEHLHTVSLEWMRERVERRVKKMGY